MFSLDASDGQRAGFTRRQFLWASTLSIAVGLPAVLAACGSGSASPAASSSAATAASPAASSASSGQSTPGAAAKPAGSPVKLPTTVPLQGVQADLPGSPDGLIDPGFLSYPKNPFKSVPNPPGKGGDINVITSTAFNPPTPLGDNPLLQAVNKELGANLKISIAPYADYKTTRLATIMAGGDLPDVLYIQPQSPLPNFPDFLKAKCADLTPYLSGDAVKDYPNLANFPAFSWKNGVFNNGIYAIPCPYPVYSWVLWTHQELLDQAGLPLPKSADDFKKTLVAMTKPDQNQWGIGTENTYGFTMITGLFPAMFGAPAYWGVDNNGKFTYTAETDGYRQALSFARELYVAGVFTPKSLTYDVSSKRNDFTARRFAFDYDGMVQASQTLFWPSIPNLNPKGKYTVVPPFSADGKAKPIFWAGQPGQTGSFGYSVVKQGSPERIKEVLGVLNYLAAPFGSHEFMLMHYGIEGVDYNLDDKNNPVLTTKGKADSAVPWPYIVMPQNYIYNAAASDFAGAIQGFEKSLLPSVVYDASLGLYSNTYTGKGTALQLALNDAINGIVKGDSPLSSFDQALKDWKSKGGDQSRTEYEQAYAAAKG